MPRLLVPIIALACLAGCATESSRSLQVQQVHAADRPFHGERIAITIGRCDDRSGHLRGVFSDGEDRLGGQARTALVAHLQESQRFTVLDRENQARTADEAGRQGIEQTRRGASFVISGDITSFGRKEVGDRQLFGILGRGKKQVAYAKVTLNVVSVADSAVAFTASGAGEYELSDREVLGFGGTSGYDATLTGKVLDLAMLDAVDRLAEGRDTGTWGSAVP